MRLSDRRSQKYFVLFYSNRVEHLLQDHGELHHVLNFAIHQVNFFGWMGVGNHSETLLLLVLFGSDRSPT